MKPEEQAKWDRELAEGADMLTGTWLRMYKRLKSELTDEQAFELLKIYITTNRAE